MSEEKLQPNPDYVTPPDGTVVGWQVNFLTGKATNYVLKNGTSVPEGTCDNDGQGEDDE